MEELTHVDPIDLQSYHHKINSLSVPDEIKYKLYQSPHIVPMLLIVTMYSKYVIYQMDAETTTHDKIELDQHEALDILLFTYSTIKYDYMDYGDLLGKFEDLFTDTDVFMELYFMEIDFLLNDITCFTQFMNSVKNHFVRYASRQSTFPNEISIYVYECLISFEMSDIFQLIQLVDDLRAIVIGSERDENNIFEHMRLLPDQYRCLNMKNYIKSLIVNLEKQQHLDEIKTFIRDSEIILDALPHLKPHGSYLINLYNKYTGVDEENNTKFNLNWNPDDFSLLTDPSINVTIKTNNENTTPSNNANNNNDNISGVAAGSIADPQRTDLTGDDLDDHQFKLKFELVRNNFDAILMGLSRSNLSHRDLQNIVSQLHHMLYYILSSNKKTNSEIHLMHFCFCWNAFIEAKFNCATDLQNKKPNIPTGTMETIDRPDFSHLTNALRSICTVGEGVSKKKKKRLLEKFRIMECFLNFYKIIHSFNVIDIDKINELSTFASNYPDMEPVCRLYRCYCYQSIGFAQAARSIIKNIVNAENTNRQYQSPYAVETRDLFKNYTISIYDRDDTFFAAHNLWMKIESNLNNLYDMDRILSDISEVADDISPQQLSHIKTMHKLNQATLRKDVIVFESSLLDMTAYHHESSEYLKHYYYRYTLLTDNCKNVIEQLQSSFIFFCENTNFPEIGEFHLNLGLGLGLDDFELLLCNAIIYAKILRRLGNHFDAIRVITVCMEKCATLNYNKYFHILIKRLIPFENLKGLMGSTEPLTQLNLKYCRFYCKYM